MLYLQYPNEPPFLFILCDHYLLRASNLPLNSDSACIASRVLSLLRFLGSAQPLGAGVQVSSNVRNHMKYLPGTEKIFDEALEIVALSNAQYSSNRLEDNFITSPYVMKGLDERSDRLIIEKVLAVAIKLRFLDDQRNLIKDNDRKNSGQVNVRGETNEVGLREALNKIIHQNSIKLFSQKRKVRVSEEFGNEIGYLKIPPGVYEANCIYLETRGKKGQEQWIFNADLTHLINEILIVVSKDSGSS